MFSHLPEQAQRLWLEDLARITRPGAAIALTSHGRPALERLLERERPGFPSPDALRSRLEELEDRGFSFFPYLGMTFEGRNKAFFEAHLANIFRWIEGFPVDIVMIKLQPRDRHEE